MASHHLTFYDSAVSNNSNLIVERESHTGGVDISRNLLLMGHLKIGSM